MSVRAHYVEACLQLGTRFNKGVAQDLPDDSLLDDVRSLDFSRSIIGRLGFPALLDVLRRCDNLTSLNLCNNYLSNDNVEALCDTLDRCCMPNLICIDLSSNPISFAAGKRLARTVTERTQIESVQLHGTLMNPALARIVMEKAMQRRTGRGNDLTNSTVSPDSASVLTDDLRQQRQQRRLSSSQRVGLQLFKSASMEAKLAATVRGADLQPTDDWYALETLWNMAAPSLEQLHGLTNVMAVVRHDDPHFVAAVQ